MQSVSPGLIYAGVGVIAAASSVQLVSSLSSARLLLLLLLLLLRSLQSAVYGDRRHLGFCFTGDYFSTLGVPRPGVP